MYLMDIRTVSTVRTKQYILVVISRPPRRRGGSIFCLSSSLLLPVEREILEQRDMYVQGSAISRHLRAIFVTKNCFFFWPQRSLDDGETWKRQRYKSSWQLQSSWMDNSFIDSSDLKVWFSHHRTIKFPCT